MQQKPTLNVLFSVDDIHPEIGYGLLKNDDQFKYLKKLHDEFGLKFTLFMVPLWHNNPKFDIRNHKDWIQWINQTDFYEIAAHGLTHQALKPEYGAMELIGITPEEMQNRLMTSKYIFMDCGVLPKGFKIPGWGAEKSIYSILKNINYNWIADHILGEEIITLSNDLAQIPYNCNTEDLNNAHPIKTAIFHSHISPLEGNRNGWTQELYEKTRDYLLKLQENYELNPLTFSEYYELKNG